MDNDANTLQNALTVLQNEHGQQLSGPKHETEVQMRRTLQQALNLNDVAADRILTQLNQTGRLVYHGGSDSGDNLGTNTTGPVISMPGTSTSGGGQIVSTASPDELLGSSSAVRGLEEEDEPDYVGNREDVSGDNTQGYWQIGQ